MSRAARVWAALSDSERADIALEVAHLPRAYQLLQALDQDIAADPRQAARAADPHAHACVSCSPDGVLPGPGCGNCRSTGMDQTPCMAPGHQPQCPHGCCGGPRPTNTATKEGGRP